MDANLCGSVGVGVQGKLWSPNTGAGEDGSRAHSRELLVKRHGLEG